MTRRLLILVGLYAVFLLGVIAQRVPNIQRWIAPSFWLFEGVPVEAAYRYTVIKSINQGTITIAGGATTNTAPIPSVTTANTYVTRNNIQPQTNADTFDSYDVNVVLTNATTVTASRHTASAQAQIVEYAAVEYLQGILKSNQDFSITLNAVFTNTAPITSVNTAKTLLVPRGADFNTTNALFGQGNGTFTLTNATTVTATRAANTNILIMYGTAVEFK